MLFLKGSVIMNLKKKGKISIMAIFLITVIIQSVVFASGEIISKKADDEFKFAVSYQDNIDRLGTMQTRTSSYTEYVLTDENIIKEELKKDNVVLPEGKKVKKIVTVVPDFSIESNQNNMQTIVKDIDNGFEPQGTIWLKYFIKNVIDLGNMWYFPNDVLHTTSGGPGGVVSQTINQNVSATYNCSVGVSAELISSNVGFDVTLSYGISDSYSVNLAPGQKGMIKSWAYYNKKSFEVWSDYLIGDDEYETTGYAYKPNGVRFRFYEIY